MNKKKAFLFFNLYKESYIMQNTKNLQKVSWLYCVAHNTLNKDCNLIHIFFFYSSGIFVPSIYKNHNAYSHQNTLENSLCMWFSPFTDHSFFGTEWQKRWCALSHHTFYYYGSEKGTFFIFKWVNNSPPPFLFNSIDAVIASVPIMMML